jgi:hypothetical protein
MITVIFKSGVVIFYNTCGYPPVRPQSPRGSANVIFGDFGAFRVSVSSKGAESTEALTARNIKKAKLVFLPGTKLKLSTLTFEVVE